MLAGRNDILGGPSGTRIKEVKSYLHRWGIKPRERIWWLTWTWAASIASRQDCDLLVAGISRAKRRRWSWPSADEIASQYVFLLLMDIRDTLQMPRRAGEHIPPPVLAELRRCGMVGDGFQRLSLEMKESNGAQD
jgi:hypothetical protein